MSVSQPTTKKRGRVTTASLLEDLETKFHEASSRPSTSAVVASVSRQLETAGSHQAGYIGVAEISSIASIGECSSAIFGAISRKLELMKTKGYDGLTCRECGRPIGQDRLEAKPWAVLCIVCKEASTYAEQYKVANNVTLAGRLQIMAVFATLSLCVSEKQRRRCVIPWNAKFHCLQAFVTQRNGHGITDGDLPVCLEQAKTIATSLENDEGLSPRSKRLIPEIKKRLEAKVG